MKTVVDVTIGIIFALFLNGVITVSTDHNVLNSDYLLPVLILSNGAAVLCLTWWRKWFYLAGYLVTALLITATPFGFLFVVIVGCTFGSCLSI